jgi:hypothetical protein
LNAKPVAVSLRVQPPPLALVIELTAGVPDVVTLKEPAVPEATESVVALVIEGGP